jgi:hypothetical protein
MLCRRFRVPEKHSLTALRRTVDLGLASDRVAKGLIEQLSAAVTRFRDVKPFWPHVIKLRRG